MARATLEMFLKVIGADKSSRELNKVSKELKDQHNQVGKNSKQNAQFAAGMSGLGKTAIAGAAIFAGKSLLDFSINAIQAASSAQEAAGAFGTTFGGAAEKLNEELAKNANLFGLTQAEAQQLISVFGAVAQGMGFTQNQSADLSSDLFTLAGDIASFNNITAGAEPVLRAFQSAIVGEREALKTYGIAISEAEVQTKAFSMTGKTSADELTRQERALATTELLFEKASVQIGNAERESEGFAAQMLIARSSTQELREELGEELLPAAGEVLRVFNEMRDESTPELINRFSDLNLQVLGLVGLFEDLRAATEKDDEERKKSVKRMTNFQRLFSGLNTALKARGYLQALDTKLEAKANEERLNTIKMYQQYANGVKATNKNVKDNRVQTNLLIPQLKKFGTTLNKDVLPFAEKLANILNLSNEAIKVQTDLQKERDEAQADLNKALEEEGLISAQEALRKKELQQQIAELTFFQNQGANVTEELAVAQEELRLVELAMTRESEQLIDARKRAAEAQKELDDATSNGTNAMNDSLEAAQDLQDVLDLFNSDNFQEQMQEAADILNITWKEAVDSALAEYARLVQQVEGKSLVDLIDEQLKLLDDQGLLVGGFTPSPLASKSVDTPADTLGDQNNINTGGNNGGGDTDLTIILEIDGDAIQKVNTKLQEQGKTFLVR